MKKIFLTTALLFYAQGAYVSVIAEEIDLKSLVTKSTFIVYAKPSSKTINHFEIKDMIKGEDPRLKPSEIIEVHPAHEDLFAAIEQQHKSSGPVPMPVIDSYKGLTTDDFKRNKELILFLSLNKNGHFRFYCDNSIERIAKLPQVKKLVNAK